MEKIDNKKIYLLYCKAHTIMVQFLVFKQLKCIVISQLFDVAHLTITTLRMLLNLLSFDISGFCHEQHHVLHINKSAVTVGPTYNDLNDVFLVSNSSN